MSPQPLKGSQPAAQIPPSSAPVKSRSPASLRMCSRMGCQPKTASLPVNVPILLNVMGIIFLLSCVKLPSAYSSLSKSGLGFLFLEILCGIHAI